MPYFEMLCCVTNHGQGSKVLKIAKQNGIKGGTICFGHGTVKNKLLEFLDLNDERRDVVIMIEERETAFKAMDAVSKEMSFHKAHHGIAFSVPLKCFIGTGNREFLHEKRVENSVYNVIFTVVEKGMAEDAVTAATEAGARGGTIINARGSGIHETETLFAIPIEPEREIVMILAEQGVTEAIIGSIREKLRIDEPCNGIIFAAEASSVYGLY